MDSFASSIEEEKVGRSLKTKLKDGLDGLQKQKQQYSTINKVEILIEMKENSAISYYTYHPKIISIGPYHHGKTNLLPMENTKLEYLKDLLLLYDKDNNLLDRIIDAACKMEDNVRDCYGEVVVNVKHDEFLKMLILDGCFIIEFLLKYNFGQVYQSMRMVNWSIPVIRKDLLLLENQIPFSILEKFCSIAQIRGAQNSYPSNIHDLAIRFLSNGSITNFPEQYCNIIPYHLLHIVHLCLDPKPTPSSRLHGRTCLSSLFQWILDKVMSIPLTRILPWLSSYVSSFFNTNPRRLVLRLVPTIVELQNFSVKFKAIERDSWNFLNIQFECGILKIPSLIINNDTISLIVNLLAFEQSRADVGSYMTNYTTFMSNIIKTTRDVATLQDANIIRRQFYNDDDVVIFFNRLGDSEMRIWKEDDQNYLDGIIQEVNEFCNNPIYRFKIIVKRSLGSTRFMVSLMATSTMFAYSLWKNII